MLQSVMQAIPVFGAKNTADAAKLTERYVLAVGKGKKNPSEKALARLHSAVKTIETANASEEGLRQRIRGMMEDRDISIRSVAATLELDASNLAKILSGDRSSGDQLIRVHAHLAE